MLNLQTLHRKEVKAEMKPGKEVLAKEAAFWGKVKQIDPRKVCHK